MKNLFIVTIVLLFISSVSIAQMKRLDFVEKKNKTKDEQGDNIRVVYFSLKYIDSKAKENEISKLILADTKVHDFLIKDFSKCYAVIDKDVSPFYIRKIIKPANVDFDYRTIIINDIGSISIDLPDDYPKYNDTGNLKQDEQMYINNCLYWKETHHEEWLKVIEKLNK